MQFLYTFGFFAAAASYDCAATSWAGADEAAVALGTPASPATASPNVMTPIVAMRLMSVTIREPAVLWDKWESSGPQLPKYNSFRLPSPLAFSTSARTSGQAAEVFSSSFTAANDVYAPESTAFTADVQ